MKKTIIGISSIISLALIFSSCSFNTKVERSIGNNDKNKPVPIHIQAETPIQTTSKVPTTEEIINTLCSDEFEGRLTGSKGNKKTEEYLKSVFKDIGLKPLFGSEYYQKYSQEILLTFGGDGSNSKIDTVNNVIGVIEGKNRKEAIIISAHFDHIGYINGKIVKGALDNSSGISALIQIADTLNKRSKEKPFEKDIVICAFNGEEEALRGSKAFVNEIKDKSLYNNFYNINIDSIGAKNGGKLALKNKSKVSNKLNNAIRTSFQKNNVEFNDTNIKGVSDNASFEKLGIPNVLIVQENIENLVHKHTDTTEILDYNQISKIANALCNFVETNHNVSFKE